MVPSSDPREAGFAYTDADRALAETMSRLDQRRRDRNPNGKGLPDWPAYRLDSEPYLEFSSPVRAGTHLLKTPLDALEIVTARSGL